MGTFAELYRENGMNIPDKKIEEFEKRLEVLCQTSGMMELEQVSMFGKTVDTIRKATIHDHDLTFCYNYFEDDCWESAGFSTKNKHIWSGKIGWKQFHTAIVAAYVLEELYVDGTAIAMVNAEPIMTHAYTGWINYLFQEKYHFKNRDPWKLFEIMHKDEDDYYLEQTNWKYFVQDIYGLMGYFEIYAVLNGTKAATAYIRNLIYVREENENESKAQKNFNFLASAEIAKKAIEEFRDTISSSEKEAALFLVEMIRQYYEQDSLSIYIGDKYEDNILQKILLFTAVSDVPAYIFKVIAETFGMDFWELWALFSNVARRKISKERKEYNQAAEKITTMELFYQSPDNMIPYWKPNGDIRFSEELQNWFREIKERFDDLMGKDIQIDNPLRWIIDLMVYADEEYYHIYTFSDFFEETIENLMDKKYIVLWKIYDEMLHNPELKEAGNVIFVPKDAEHEELVYFETPSRHRLIKSWCVMEKDKRFNKARVTLRRYMALTANKELRKKVFGF